MNKKYTVRLYEYISKIFLFIVLIAGSCSAPVEQEPQEANRAQEAVNRKITPVTVAAIKKTSDEVYFDLIAETQNCLGENLWLGGKLESTDKVVLTSSGAFSKSKEFKVTELTATGLNSNNHYLVGNAMRALYDESGIIYLQLNEGQIKLQPDQSAAPIVMAYQPQAEDSFSDGSISNWDCQ